MRNYKIVVVGGGHAGIEAASAAARLGVPTALVTLRRDRIGEMSCNPAIGGLAKGQIVREVDAVGGLMGIAADRAGIQFRVLNASKGPAVRAPRAQEDKAVYRSVVQALLADTPNLDIIEAEVRAIACAGERVTGVMIDGELLPARAVVITGGTFLNGLIHCGEQRWHAGRMGENASLGLSDQLMAAGLRMKRLKTGTPPRIHRDSIDYSRFAEQPGDDPPVPFSFMTRNLAVEQVRCYIGHTNAEVHRIIADNIGRSPLYSGQIAGIGPRYCPSIEDKVVKFPDKESHHIFIEPEVRGGESMYINGVSTSMPEEVQHAFIRAIPGMENAIFLRPGYAIEYDALDPLQLRATLETKAFRGLYCAGQINGTSGYEEAAGQGVVAGINAALAVQGRDSALFDRSDSYIGVMIDDLITHGADEPYRMFTSRAENRLQLRADNADRRLTEFGRAIGLVDDERWRLYEEKRERFRMAEEALTRRRYQDGTEAQRAGLELRGGLKNAATARELLKRPEVSIEQLVGDIAELEVLIPEERLSLETDEKYAGYVRRQQQHRDRIRGQESRVIPEGHDFSGIPGISTEMAQRLSRVRPETLGQAARIPGITPAAVAALAIDLARRRDDRHA